MLTPQPTWQGFVVAPPPPPSPRPASRAVTDEPFVWLSGLSLWERRTAWLLAFMTALRLLVISATGLSDTEAYYFTWSHFPDWSYYDHPPLTAWLMWLTTSESPSPFFIRISSVACAALFGFLVYRLTVRLFASPRAGFLAVLVVSILPGFFFTSFLANPEAPLAPLWVLYLLLLDDLRRHDEPWRPLAIGAVIGVGFLAKYTALLAVPLALLFVAASPDARRWLRRPSFYLAGLVALGVASPVVFWNWEHHWPSVALHLVERMPSAGASTLASNARRILVGQLTLFHPVVFPGLIAMLGVAVQRARTDARYRFLAIASGPTLLFFFAVMVRAADAEPHWTMVGYVPLAIAAAGWGDEQLARGTWRGTGFNLHLGGAVAFSALLGATYAGHVATARVSALVPDAAYDANADPLTETLGWDQVRTVIDAEAARLGSATVVAGEHNVLCGHLYVAMDDRPEVYCPSPRRTEFDFLGRRDPPANAPVLYVDSARYPGDPARALPHHTCAAFRDVSVERGARVLGHYRIHECLPRSEAER